ncbi:putative motility protein [Schinkia azotoformans MEV2011]|uniref:Putative motility protein n=1 Tax=Schinkia azotoformans MEV2011 TaxID=1348973 RepID=A0A072NZY7_SCHAZ|nr:YjfB family protein [Schinkia azotoformans]KEF38810.1 putative motility protein [Schinkia azotoformans MEV2011]MEC1693968.1 YjfB family protein [Schinkia azotoformans]MEC1714208.1 YjfB family protein [Schinkia azotoformans]MEC1724571.1 YjfB family protein [Schinkia azotoformans]MEC1742423.1 YjfB family protein [Schinkia azotoformans]
MDIAALSTAMSQVNLGQQVSIALTKKVMDTAEVNANALTEMLKTSSAPAPHPTLGKFIDISG